MGYRLSVSGETALTLQGCAHYLPFSEPGLVHLLSDGQTPTWLARLDYKVRFSVFDGHRLFRIQRMEPAIDRLKSCLADDTLHWHQPFPRNFTYSASAGPDRPFLISRSERAILEVMDELTGDRTRFHTADVLMEILYDLIPNRVEQLLRDCYRIRVKRLFFWFTESHGHA